ncbi:phosphopyruvate hydratase [Thomasclavelia ramosa]|uniref:phosphopyruvate hydratase n=1 Tax=Thomasclavelia ramosa TaxID=1547 RepID=UPI00233F31C9|nr:phosphopyruvate hydratase [Thomasclavelia ramosa]MDC2831711.1 phosphopyruvate hydratase [Thomasclavelia ramosa]
MPYISNVYARQVLDSRGFPTIQVEVTTESGFSGSAIVPSGASTGKYEALELRDNDDARYRGKSVFKAINNVNETIAKLIKEKSVLEQREIDLAMIRFDNTENKEKLGANAMLAVSLAVANCAANYLEIPLYRYLGGCNAHVLPTPMINIVNGGSHATNSLDFQEFMIMPISANSFYQAMEMATNVFHTLKDILKRSNLATSVGDEGGFAPNLESNDDALELIIKAIKECNYEPGKDISIALDVAASELYQNGIYTINGKQYTSDELIKYYEQLVSKYPIISIEDGLDQEDYTGWKKLTSRLGAKIQLVGDDLFVTNTNRLKAGIAGNYSNSILIKLNQIGTLSETIDCIEMAVKNQIAPIISHRSGESEDTFISDLAVGLNIGQIKTGSMSRSERICKYNRLLKVEDDLVGNSCYQGKINNK